MFKDGEYSVGDKFVLEVVEKSEYGPKFNNGFHCTESFMEDLEVLNGDYVNEYFGEMQDEAYIAGMNEMWELSKKLFLNERDGGVPDKDMEEIFGAGWSVEDILANMTPMEVLKKIEGYKHRIADKVSYGDVVRADGINGIVLDNYNDHSWHVYTENGTVETWTHFVKLGNRGQTLEHIRLGLAKEGVPDEEEM